MAKKVKQKLNSRIIMNKKEGDELFTPSAVFASEAIGITERVLACFAGVGQSCAVRNGNAKPKNAQKEHQPVPKTFGILQQVQTKNYTVNDRNASNNKAVHGVSQAVATEKRIVLAIYLDIESLKRKERKEKKEVQEKTKAVAEK
jgi:hypothetical protein